MLLILMRYRNWNGSEAWNLYGIFDKSNQSCKMPKHSFDFKPAVFHSCQYFFAGFIKVVGQPLFDPLIGQIHEGPGISGVV